MITILLEITLVFEESKKLIVKFIGEYGGTPTKNQVVDYMNKVKPVEFQTSRVTTLSLIDELDGDRIRVLKGERRGQSHRLSINDNSRFDWIDQHLSKIAKDIEKMDKDKPEEMVKTKKGKTFPASELHSVLTITSLCALVAHTSRDIKNKNDQQILNNKILQLMFNIGIKNLGRFTKKLRQD